MSRIAASGTAERVATKISSARRLLPKGRRFFPWLFLAPLFFARPAGALGELPILTLVRVDVGKDVVVSTVDTSLGRDSGDPRDTDLFFAFGAPGAPRAIDAILRFEGGSGVQEETLSWSLATRARKGALVVSGPKETAGITVRIPEATLRRATRYRSRCVIRIRAIHPLPAADASGLREVRVRVTPSSGEPPALFRIEMAAQSGTPAIERARAFFCGRPEDSLALGDVKAPRALSPLLTSRAPGETLCLQFSTVVPPPVAASSEVPRKP